MAYHTPLTNSQEFTAALQMARELAHNITLGMRNITGTSSDFEVFPYTYVLFISHAPSCHLCSTGLWKSSFLSFFLQNWT